MPEPPLHPELMPALGRLIRGLSALFWGLPLALVVCAHLALKSRLELRAFDLFFPTAANGMLLYGVILLGAFHPQERIWIQALERARVLALALVGLSPFLYWRVLLPEIPVYPAATGLLAAFGLLFLYHLNHVLQRLTAMLPDESLRQETMVFTTLNQYLLAAIPLCLGFLLVLVALAQSGNLPHSISRIVQHSGSANEWLFLLLILLPTATTMALIWKIKEMLMDSVFGRKK
jgi:hypothetical protein